MTKLKNHYAPTPSRIARCHAFHRRYQEEGESINQYVAALRTAALYCDFRYLDDVLLDQLVCGVRDICLQCRLLAKTDITLQTALDKAHVAEMSTRLTADIHRVQSPLAAKKQKQKKTIAVHHDKVDPEDVTDDDEDVNHFKTARGKSWATEKKPPQVSCVQAACKFKDVYC